MLMTETTWNAGECSREVLWDEQGRLVRIADYRPADSGSLVTYSYYDVAGEQ